ncbi:RNA pol II accessory factor, Cdc73 family-domain-containing protein [Thamnocephalis sphaerospora]|uniref:RNA pol II accessory factor, Cdc73 family-domain-containing protein n=1 Tax=Thamnocephalis sphaerospora TaxID=78915 RepID=A0A4P9XSK4_9FUNG|nr:RNA pol II accessory factor, Cdc73 family-domain-containing protein [Thamnocephalis sphaerospora]|eukprot:RKP09117.1 RNA pol II accessory factor, Cdc73 family-domain-containing protein [Thamnocephalis sphaerospora]
MEALEPSALLQQYAADKASVQLLAGDGQPVQQLDAAEQVVFGGEQFPKTRSTTLRKSGSEEYYTVETLLFMVDHRESDFLGYLKAGVSAAIPTVSMMDRGKLLGMLTAVANAPAGAPKRPAFDAGSVAGMHAEKKARNDAETSEVFDEKVSTDAAVVKTIVEREQEVLSRNALICSNRSFDDLYKRVRDLLSQQSTRKKAAASGTKATPVSKQATGSRATPARTKGTRIPIIIVPAAATSILNLYNVKQFLQDRVFLDSRIAREQSSTRPTSATIERHHAGGEAVTIYQVVDSVDRLRPDDWKRVVAVFVTGAEWQFKNWVWQNPLDIFSNVKGYYVKYSDEQPKDNVLRWNVTTLEASEKCVHRHKRHTDQVVVGEFWNTLDAFVASKRA